jgi:hypothetical protein
MVVEALLIAIYLPGGKDVYIHIRPTSLPEATSFSCRYAAEPATSRLVATETRPVRSNLESHIVMLSPTESCHCRSQSAVRARR